MFAPTYESGDNKKEEKQQEEVLAQPPLPTTTISSPVEEDYLNGPSLLSHDYLLDRYLQRLHLFLTVSGFDHGTHFRRILSWLFFGSFGVAFPFAIFITHYNTLEGLKFLSIIFVSQTILAAVSFYSISSKLQKHGIVRFLFVDSYHDQFERFRREYILKILVWPYHRLSFVFLIFASQSWWNNNFRLEHRSRSDQHNLFL